MKKRFENVEFEISNGRLWRAKEILSGMMAGTDYDVDLFEKMGVVLLKMGDDREAGKYLFLSGVRSEKINPAIELFWSGAQKSSFVDFWSSMPTRAKIADYATLPSSVKSELLGLEFAEKSIDLAFKKYTRLKKLREKQRKNYVVAPTRKGQVVGWLIFGASILFAIGILYQSGLGLYAIWTYF